ncbi:hypothetical protein BKA69DRAFT_1072403, partial [Paraphysoderma sedebokerense]
MFQDAEILNRYQHMTSGQNNENGSSNAFRILNQLLSQVKLIVYEKLRVNAEEEKFLDEELRIISARESKLNAEINTIQDQLEKARKERTVEVDRRNDAIRKLKDELRHIKLQADEKNRNLELKTKQTEEGEWKSFSQRESEMQQQIVTLEKVYNDTLVKNREEEMALRKKKDKIESEVEAWIQKYDQDMEEKQTEIDDITVRS